MCASSAIRRVAFLASRGWRFSSSLFVCVSYWLLRPKDPLRTVGMLLALAKQSALLKQGTCAALHVGVQTLGDVREFPPPAREAGSSEDAFHLRALFLKQGDHLFGHSLTQRLELGAVFGPEHRKVRLVVTLGRVLLLPLD